MKNCSDIIDTFLVAIKCYLCINFYMNICVYRVTAILPFGRRAPQIKRHIKVTSIVNILKIIQLYFVTFCKANISFMAILGSKHRLHDDSILYPCDGQQQPLCDVMNWDPLEKWDPQIYIALKNSTYFCIIADRIGNIRINNYFPIPYNLAVNEKLIKKPQAQGRHARLGIWVIK